MHSRSGRSQRLRQSVGAARDCGVGLGSEVRAAAVDSGAQGRVSDTALACGYGQGCVQMVARVYWGWLGEA